MDGKLVLRVVMIATGTFSVAVLANLAGTHLLSEDPKHKKVGVLYATGGIAASVLILAALNDSKTKHFKGSPL